MKIKITLLVLFGIILTTCQDENKFKSDSDYGQYAPKDAYDEDPQFAYYGSENEWNRRMFSEKASNRFYKRRGQRQLLALLDGNADEAIKLCNIRLSEDKYDLESLFILTIAYCQSNQIENAVQTAQISLERGLPFERFLAGPRDLLEPLFQYDKFIDLKKKKNIKLIHGPLLGAVTDSSARLWFRTVNESEVKIEVFSNRDSNKPIGTAVNKSSAELDFTVIIQLTGLKPNKKYFYDVIIDGEMVKETLELTTFPTKGERKTIRVAFGGGAGYTPEHEKIWDVISDYDPDALLLLGDNVYIDLPQMPNAFHDYTYYRRQSRPEFRNLVAAVPTFTIWDDHDAGTDDVWMGPYLDKPEWKLPILKQFEVNWNNPAYGTEETPGCYYNFSIGEIDFFMLDSRFYRTNPFKDERTMLGEAQKEWLKKSLLKSTGDIKFIVSSVPWALKAKPGSKDTWAGFEKEREELFDFIEENKIEGLFLLSADRHRSDAWKIERENGYDLYEFMSSRLTNIHTHELMPEALIGYNEECSFGILDIDTEANDKKVTYKIVSIDGEVKDSLTVQSSKLQF